MAKTQATPKRRSQMKEKLNVFSFNPHAVVKDIREALLHDLGVFDKNPLPLSLLYEQKNLHLNIFARRMIDEINKKFVEPSSDKEKSLTRRNAISDFQNNVMRLRDFDPRLPVWTGGPFQGERPEYRSIVLARARQLVAFILGEVTLDEVFAECKHSGGTTVGLGFRNTNLSDKCTFPLSATKVQAKYFLLYLDWDPQLKESLFKVNDTGWKVLFHLDPYSIFDIVEWSCGTTVDKSIEIDRLIAKETTIGMFLQKGIESLINSRFQRTTEYLFGKNCLDYKQQQHIHRLRASIAYFLKESTIDLQRASDNWLISVVKFFLPPRWFMLLDNVRSPLMQIDGEVIDLPMFSTMGNAFTFPLETLLFFAITAATLSVTVDNSTSVFPSWELIKRGVCTVFGDDIIVSNGVFQEVCEILTSLGHQVNEKKSFSSDSYFRESCGGDYYDYRNVRPFHLKWPNGTRGRNNYEAWLNVITNRLIKKYITCFGPLNYIYYSIFEVLRNLYDRDGLAVRLVPDHFPDDAGLKLGDDIYRSPFRNLRRHHINRDKHHTAKFSYLRYVWPSTDEEEDILYWMSLKFPSSTDSPLSRYNDKRNGTYRSSEALCGHWNCDLFSIPNDFSYFIDPKGRIKTC